MNKINDQYRAILDDDWQVISSRKDNVIAGFLNIGKAEGWNQEEGGLSSTGWRFTRYMFASFCKAESSLVEKYHDILERVHASFFTKILHEENTEFGPRAFPDPTVCGWKEHIVTYLMGYVGSKRSENGPFFEVYINSARTSVSNELCFPFKVAILLDKKDAIARKKELRSAKDLPATFASSIYYHSSVAKKVDTFQDIYKAEHGKSPGEKSMRMLNALKILENTQLKAQTMGNCWMKQNERLVLVLLYIEIITHCSELNEHEAWDQAQNLYKKWIEHTKVRVEGMLNGTGISLDLDRLARKKLHPQVV